MAKIQKIRKILKQKKPFLLKRYKIKELGIFGSYLRAEGAREAMWICSLTSESLPVSLNSWKLKII